MTDDLEAVVDNYHFLIYDLVTDLESTCIDEDYETEDLVQEGIATLYKGLSQLKCWIHQQMV